MPGPGPLVRCLCSFCGRDQEEVGLLFRSEIGGVPPFVCSDCAEWFAKIAEANRRSPVEAAAMIAAHNAVANQAKKAAADAIKAAR